MEPQNGNDLAQGGEVDLIQNLPRAATGLVDQV